MNHHYSLILYNIVPIRTSHWTFSIIQLLIKSLESHNNHNNLVKLMCFSLDWLPLLYLKGTPFLNF